MQKAKDCGIINLIINRTVNQRMKCRDGKGGGKTLKKLHVFWMTALSFCVTAMSVFAEPAANEGQPAGLDISQIGPTVLYFAVIIAVFYFLLIRPQRKKDKEQKDMLNALKKGDKIITIGGFHGKIVSVKNNVLTVQIGDMKAKMESWAVKEVTKRGDELDEIEESSEEPETEEEA